MDLDVKIKAVMIGTVFLIVSQVFFMYEMIYIYDIIIIIYVHVYGVYSVLYLGNHEYQYQQSVCCSQNLSA